MPLPSGDSLLVKIMSDSFADAAARAGQHLVCREGCSQCCHGAFALGPLDALRLQAGMETLRASDPNLAREVEHRASMWTVEHEAAFPGDFQTGILGDTPEERERFESFANEAPCPALDTETGRCDVYKWRPMTCRLFGPPVRMGEGQELAHCELCFKGASEAEVAACEMEVPFELESEILAEIPSKGETVVAFALLK
ncbi:MAG: YkgJ family cysteine cluster protein [Terracidiphilus sp.]